MSVSAAELAARVTERGLRLNTTLAQAFLEAWAKQGIVEQQDGRWQLSERGRCMFEGWDVNQAMAGD